MRREAGVVAPAENVGMFHYHHRAWATSTPTRSPVVKPVRNLAFLEQPHHLFFQVSVEAAMQATDAQVWVNFLLSSLYIFHRGFQFSLFVFLRSPDKTTYT